VRQLKPPGWGVVKSLGLIGSGPVGLVHTQKIGIQSEKPTCTKALEFTQFASPCGTDARLLSGEQRTSHFKLVTSVDDPAPDMRCRLADLQSWPRERRRALSVFMAGVAMPAMGDQLFDKLHGIGWQKTLRIPGEDGPSSDGRPTMQQHRRPNTRAGNPYGRGNHSNTVAGPSQCDERLRRDAFEQHARPNVRDMACGLEPAMRGKARAETQQRFVCKLRHFEHGTPT
jgi:hypothetical protein